MMKNDDMALSLRYYELILPLMKRFLFILLACAFTVLGSAQERNRSVVDADVMSHATLSEPVTVLDEVSFDYEKENINNVATVLESVDTLHLPSLNSCGQVCMNMYPLGWNGLYDWNLHRGLNLNIGASVFATFGKKAWRGAGFGQNIAAVYVLPMTDKLSIAIGGYINNLYWAYNSYCDAGVNAVIGYRFDEHWEGYIYGQKSLVGRRMPLPLYDVSNIGDRIGAAIRYNFSPSVSVQVSVEREKR